MAGLFQRIPSLSPMCPICLDHVESVEHMLLLCPWVKPVWYGGILNFRMDRAKFTALGTWLLSLINLDLGSTRDKEIILSHFAFTCWHVWNARCNFLFNHGSISPNHVLLAISSPSAAFLEANREVHVGLRVVQVANSPTSHWTPPYTSFVKFNVDASWDPATTIGFVGVVARDQDGCFVAVKRLRIKTLGVAVAEVQLGFGMVTIESDSNETISCLCGYPLNGSWEAFPTLVKILRFGESFQACGLPWIPRSANMVADHLASRTNMKICDFTWVNWLPSSLVHVLNNDRLPCPS
ncbi:unnamed protein product [Malus baccata var. baccata]